MAATILGLPLECLQRIVEETIPESIENVALTCRQFHNASMRFLPDYNNKTKRFRNFAFSNLDFLRHMEGEDDTTIPWDPVTEETGYLINHTVALLEAIAKEPVIARYLKTITLRSTSRAEEIQFYEYDDDNNVPHMGHISNRLSKLICSSPDLYSIGADPEVWIQRMSTDIGNYNPEPVCPWAEAFLLTMMPHVTSIQLPKHWDAGFPSESASHKCLLPLLDHLVNRANDQNLPEASLSHLRTIQPHHGCGYETRKYLAPALVLSGIDSVRELYIGGCVLLEDGRTGLPFEPYFKRMSPNIELIEMVGCAVGSPELENFLSLANAGNNLRVFRLGYQVKWDGCGYHWDVADCLDTIIEHCGESLEELAMVAVSYDGQGWVGSMLGSTISDLTGFCRLKSLTLDIHMLVSQNYVAVPSRDTGMDYYSTSAEDLAWPRLVDILPKSIEQVDLWLLEGHPGRLDCITKLFKDFKSERSNILPHLKSVKLKVHEDVMDEPGLMEALREAEDLGAHFVTITGEDGHEFTTSFRDRFGVDVII